MQQRSDIPYKIQVKVISAEGTCPNGHKLGDEWNIYMKTPDKPMCLVAFYNLFNPIRVLETGGSYPHYEDPDSYQTYCPDIRARLLFEIRRILPPKVAEDRSGQ
jgi:uncharacterized repeat protein (TIGR04076 family)